MNLSDINQLVSKETGLPISQVGRVLEEVFTEIGRKLSEGEPVDVSGLGRFFTAKYPAHATGDPDSGGAQIITLPSIEPEFEPDSGLTNKVAEAIKANPDLFQNTHDDETDEEEGDGEVKPAIPVGDQAVRVSEPLQIKGEDAGVSEENQAESGQEKAQAEKADAAEDSNKKETVKEKPLGRASNIEFVDVSHMKVDREILGLLPETIARRYGAAPIDLKEGTLTVAMIDPEDFDALQVIRKETGLVIKPVLTTRDDLSMVLDQYTGLQAELQEVIDHSDLGITKKDLAEASQEDLQNQTNENAPTAKIVFSLLKRAVKERASDVHIEPYEHKVMVRFRVDGVLQPKVELPKEIQSATISRLKILANLKIDEQRLPQDGRFNLIVDHRQVDFRLSTMPVVFGEKVVMRILDKSVGIITLEEVGLSNQGLEVLSNNIKRSHGMILVTGPTGSGKTTSLYAVLGKLMSETVNILTLEDPVEYRIESINQSQVHPEIGYTFAAGLRTVVRQDPDIVMLGEVRDQETADMAIHAALTGHVVLSTLHTNDAAGAFPRLIDMGIEPFLITSALHTVVAQRLARKVCQECKHEVKLEKEALTDVKKEIERMPKGVKDSLKGKTMKFYAGKGCDACSGKGYKGRIGVFEVLNVSEEIRGLVLQRSSGSDIAEMAINKGGMVTMIQDGILKALEGLTTMEEVWRVTRE